MVYRTVKTVHCIWTREFQLAKALASIHIKRTTPQTFDQSAADTHEHSKSKSGSASLSIPFEGLFTRPGFVSHDWQIVVAHANARLIEIVMERHAISWRREFTSLIIGTVLVFVNRSAFAQGQNPDVVSPQQVVAEMTYGQWSAACGQRMLAILLESNCPTRRFTPRVCTATLANPDRRCWP